MNEPTATATRSLLGEIVTWDLGSMEIPLTRVRDALNDAGLPTDAIGDLRTATAFSRAIKDLRAGRAIDKVQTDKGSGVTVFQFTRKTLDEAKLALDFAFEAKCTLDPSGTITCPDSPAIEAHARTMFAHALTHRMTSDITRLVQRMFSTHADLYPINPRKGVAYFVPERFRVFSAQMEDFLSALGGQLLRFPVPKGTPEGTRAVKESVESGLLALSEELEEAVDGWSDSTRGATMDHAIERWGIIKHKAEAYSEYLGDRQAALLAKLAEQRKRLAAKVSEITALKEEKKVAPDSNGDTQGNLLPAGPAEEPVPADPTPYAHTERGDLPPDFAPTEAGEAPPEPDGYPATVTITGDVCPNCGAREFDEDGDCAQCREPGVVEPQEIET